MKTEDGDFMGVSDLGICYWGRKLGILWGFVFPTLPPALAAKVGAVIDPISYR